MKTFSFLGKIAAVTAIMMSAVTFSAKAEDLVVNAKDFTKIETTGAISVAFVQAPTYQIVARGEQRDLDNLDIHVFGNTLFIGRRSGMHRSGSVKVEVMAPEVNAISLSGASNITIGENETETMSLRCSGASNVKGRLVAKSLTISCSGASDVDVDLKCETVKLTCSGASNLDLRGKSGNVSGSCSGASNVRLHGSSSSANVNTSGASNLRM